MSVENTAPKSNAINIPLPLSRSLSPFTPLTSSPVPSPLTPLTPVHSPDSLPDLISISDSRSESDSFSFTPQNHIAAMTANATMTTLLKKDSNTVYIGKQGKPPVVTAGKLTPKLLFNFENSAYLYFSYKDLAKNKQVSHVARGLQDGCI